MTSNEENISSPISKDFKNIIVDLKRDLLITFPELIDKFTPDIINIESDDETIINIWEYCKSIFPERFFDIIYQNNSIFEDDDVNTFFLPNIDFKLLMNDPTVTDKTKEVLWKYLQLILISITSSLDSTDSFGDTAKLFEAIDENELKQKLSDLSEQMDAFFKENENGGETPDMKDVHEHLNGILDGKLGRLAQEIAKDTAESLEFDIDESDTDPSKLFQKLMKNPNKLMDIVKTIGNKVDEKIKSGEINESELMEEATDMMTKMKDIPGMPKNIQEILKNMGGRGKSQFEQKMKMAKTKERMNNKLNEKKNRLQETKWTDGTNPEKTYIDDVTREKIINELIEDEDKSKIKKKKSKRNKKTKKD